MELKEVPYLDVAISYLKDFEKAKDVYDWEIGKHGIQIRFTVDGNSSYISYKLIYR